MSNHEPGFALTEKALAYLKCHPTPAAHQCGACNRSQEACFTLPCGDRITATGA